MNTLILLLAVSLHAQDWTVDPKNEAKTEKGVGEAISNQRQLWDWLIGTKTQIGAYKAPALCCRLSRQMSKNYLGKREALHKGLSHDSNFLLALLSSKRCAIGPAVPPSRGGPGQSEQLNCSSEENDGLPESAVLPALPGKPSPLRVWSLSQEALSKAQQKYHEEFEKLSESSSVTALEKARKAFFDEAFKLALTDESLRKQLAELFDRDPSSMKTDELYTKARAKVDAK
jgi:hypothetical protein